MRGAAFAATVAALELCACGPLRVWEHRDGGLAVVELGQRQYLVEGDLRSRSHDAIAPASVRKLRSGGWAYAARDGATWRVFLRGRQSPPFLDVGAVVEAPLGEVVFAARNAEGWWVLEAPRRFGPYSAIGANSLQVAGKGRSLYTARSPAGWAVYLNGVRLGRVYDAVAGLQAREDSVPGTAFVGRREDGWHVVVDGREGPPHAWVQELKLAARASRAAWLAGDLDVMSLYVDGQPILGPEPELGGLRMSPEGRAVAVIVRRDGRDAAWRDGRLHRSFDRIRDETFILTPRGLGYVAEAGARALPIVPGVEPRDFESVEDFQHEAGWGFIGWDKGAFVYVRGEWSRHSRAYDLRLGPLGGWAYAAESPSGEWVHTPRGADGPYREVVEGTLTLSQNGESYAALVLDGREVWLLVNGVLKQPYDPRVVIHLGMSSSLSWWEPLAPMRAWLARQAETGERG